jgi:hypothetical protein
MSPSFLCSAPDCRWFFPMNALLDRFNHVGAFVNLRCPSCGRITQVILREIYLVKGTATLGFDLTLLPAFVGETLFCENDPEVSR